MRTSLCCASIEFTMPGEDDGLARYILRCAKLRHDKTTKHCSADGFAWDATLPLTLSYDEDEHRKMAANR